MCLSVALLSPIFAAQDTAKDDLIKFLTLKKYCKNMVLKTRAFFEM